jgi:hypothetical protein
LVTEVPTVGLNVAVNYAYRVSSTVSPAAIASFGTQCAVRTEFDVNLRVLPSGIAIGCHPHEIDRHLIAD